MVNIITGRFVPVLVDGIYKESGEDGVVALHESLDEFYVSQQYDALITNITARYNATGVSMPIEVKAVFDYGDRELLEVFFYEFISDIGNELADLMDE